MTEGKREPVRPTSLRPAKACPICGKRAGQAAYPFCSKRCADLDLNRWLSGVYAIPAEDVPEDAERDGALDQDLSDAANRDR